MFYIFKHALTLFVCVITLSQGVTNDHPMKALKHVRLTYKYFDKRYQNKNNKSAFVDFILYVDQQQCAV
jgi:flagellar biosynthesis regulator FlbT